MPERPLFPRLPLIGIFAVLGIAIAGAAVGRATHYGAIEPTGHQVKSRDLVFQDRDDGAVVARASPDQHVVEVFQGEQGFLRGTLRGLARVRHRRDLGPEAPFHLARWSDGRLTIDDTATGEHLELLAFGHDNAAVFAKLLDATP